MKTLENDHLATSPPSYTLTLPFMNLTSTLVSAASVVEGHSAASLPSGNVTVHS